MQLHVKSIGITTMMAVKQPWQLSHRFFLAIWCLILVFQCISIGYLWTTAYWYFDLTNPGGFFHFLKVVFLFSRSQAFLLRYNVMIASGYLVLSVPFIYSTVEMLWYSAYYKRVAFGKQEKPTKLRTLQRLWTFLQPINIRGRYFYGRLIILEAIEMVLQIIQAYRASRSIGNVLINQCYGLVICINGLSSPLIHYYYASKANSALKQRLISVLIDAILDFGWGTIIQIWLLAPYWRYYQTPDLLAKLDTTTFTPELADRELQQILVLSLPQFALVGFPFVGSAMTMHTIRRLLAQHNTEFVQNEVAAGTK